MKKFRTLFTTSVITLILLTITGTAGMQQQPTSPNPPLPLRKGEVWVNPKPGVVAPGSTDPNTRTVTASKGYGDASLSYFLNYVTAWGQTWLNNTIKNDHFICARVITLDDNGVSRGGNAEPSCITTRLGGSVSNAFGGVPVACGHFVATRTYHSIYRSGSYNWGTEDFDAFNTFCG